MTKRMPVLAMVITVALLAQAQQRHSDAIDDLLQHTPMAAVFVLKACDLENNSSWPELTLTAVSSYAISAAVSYSLKQIVSERRPDHSDRRSFPSGHATFAFA